MKGVPCIKNLIEKHKLLPVLLAALLTAAVLAALVKLTGTIGPRLNCVTVAEQKGVYDLTDIGDLEGTIALLTPGTAYYPNTYLEPKNADTAVPESIHRYKELRADYLSQKFILRLPDNSDVYMLTFSLSGRHAMRVYVNGRLAGQAGRPGTTKEETEVWENNITCYGAAVNGKMEIILNSAQFYHAKRGASLAQLSLSKSGAVPDMFFYDRMKGILTVGVFLSAAAMLTALYLLLSPVRANLYFAMASVIMALRELLRSKAWIYFPIPGNLSFMLEYMSMVLLTIFLSLYLGQYAIGRFLQGVRYTAIIGSCVYGVCLLFGDSIFYTSVLKYYQLLLMLCIVPGIIRLFWNMRRPTKEQSVAIYGIGVFYIAAVYDILLYSGFLGDGLKLPISENAMVVFALTQAFSLFLMNSRVLGEAKETERKLAAEKEALEDLNRMKTKFLGNISHELKTPLTVMSGYAQTIRQLAQGPGKLDNEKVAHRMKLISSEAERLSLMVGQILDVTRMEEGRMSMELKPCYVDEIIHGAVETHYPMLNKNANRLEIQIERGLPAVNADSARISQVIVNLISNAVRFTANGLITISAKREDAHILICVTDTGSGINREQLPYIFERYYHRQKSGGGQDTGTGLGLYICRNIVEQHGGSIWLESEEGRGTSVFFTLPVL